MGILLDSLRYAAYWLNTFIDGALTVYMYAIVAAALITWVNPDPYNPVVRFLYRITEPLLGRIRKLLPSGWAIDISPMIAFVLIMLVKIIVFGTIDRLLTQKYRMITPFGF